ncbi:cold shock domain-containing protein [Massilia sp. Root351]|uniref:cold shock domain-containing protein n=1 Tax=Massilia sp. Root351 TaxID=1736522 RepID=UPI0012F6985D
MVKWFNDANGFGLIMPDAAGADLYAHFGGIQSTGFKIMCLQHRADSAGRRRPMIPG